MDAPTGSPTPSPTASRAQPRRREAGQSAVELVALLPLIGVVAAIVWQLLLAGGALWFGGVAARAAARAEAVGADPVAAARRALPGRYERGMRVRRDGGEVAVVVRVPAAFGDRAVGAITTRAHFEAQR